MANHDKKLLEISSFKLDQPACGLIAEENRRGTLSASNWLTNTVYLNNTVLIPVNHARILLEGKSDKDIKDIWLAIENLCARWRIENDMQINPGQKLLPIRMIAYTNQLHTWQLAKDGDLFFYLESDGRHELSESLMADLKAILANGIKELLAITILYEHHIGRASDLMQTYSALLAIRANELQPHAEKVAEMRKRQALGHESVYGTQEEKQSRWNEYQVYVNDLQKKNPRLSYRALKDRAAKHFDVSAKTIQRHTINPKN